MLTVAQWCFDQARLDTFPIATPYPRPLPRPAMIRKYDTAAAYADQVFTKPTIGNRDLDFVHEAAGLSDRARG
jgi:hypothetical protein